MRIIGVAGAARSGKDTIASWLVEHRDAYKYSFAMPIKRGLSAMFGIETTVWDSDEKEQVIPAIGKSPRQLAQTLGTEWGRNLISPDIWVIATKLCIDSWASSIWAPENPLLVIPDVRFENEASFVRERGTLLHVYRDGADGNVGVVGHESERGVQFAGGDILISNNGSIEELHAKLGALFPS